MEINYRKIPHPKIRDRDITFIFVNNKLDLPSSRFLIYEATYGGRNKSVPGKKSHLLRANRIGELYRHLDDLGLTWYTANEQHIKMIRNGMLCWNSNNNKDYKNFNYDPISNNTMNAKIGSWFKFYNYMTKIGEFHEMVMSTKKIIKPKYATNMLDHINNRNYAKDKYIDAWSLRVKPDPSSHTYHAISRTEYSHLECHLIKLDIVYVMIAYIMVETGLRVDAALEIKYEDFRFLFKYLNSGLSLNDCVKIGYFAKGGDYKYCDIPIRAIARIQKEYLSREYIKRKKLYSERCNRLKKDFNEKVIWLTKTGKEVNYNDFRNVLIIVSNEMGRNNNRITSHWLRHTFATWTLIDYCNEQNIPIKNTGITPDVRVLTLLMDKLGHITMTSTMKYIMTALKLMKIGSNKGPILSLKNFRLSKESQELIRLEALNEFGEDYKEELFNVEKYAISRQIVVNDNFL